VKLDLKAVYDKVDSRFKRSQQELLSQTVSASGPKPSESPTQSSPPAAVNQILPTPVLTPPVATTLNSTRPEPPAGLRNRKKTNTRTAAYLAAELITEKTPAPTPKWIKTEGAEEESRGSKDRSSLSEDVSNNNVRHAPESKKYVEVTGKRKGKVNVGKPKSAWKPAQTKSEEISSGTEASIPDVFENFANSTTAEFLPVNAVSKDDRRVSTKPITSNNGIAEDGSEKIHKPAAKKSPKSISVSPQIATEQAPKIPSQSAARYTAESKMPPVKVPAESVPKIPTQPASRNALESISKVTNESTSKQGSSTGANNSEGRRSIVGKQKQLSGSSSSGSHGRSDHFMI